MKHFCNNDRMLAQYISGTLSDDQNTQFEIHLTECDACRNAFAGAQLILNDKTLNAYHPIPLEMARDIVRELSFLGQLTKKFNQWIEGIIPDPIGSLCVSPVKYRSAEQKGIFIHIEHIFDDLKSTIVFIRHDDQLFQIKLFIHVPQSCNDTFRLKLMRDETLLKYEKLTDQSIHLKDAYSFGTYGIYMFKNGIQKGQLKFTLSTQGFMEE